MTDAGLSVEQLVDGLKHLPKDLFIEAISHMTVRELAILTEIEAFAGAAHDELEARLKGLWKPYGLPVGETKRMMEDYPTVMSGSCATYMAAPGVYIPDDIDFYTAEGNLIPVVEYFISKRYEVVPWGEEDGAEEGALVMDDDGTGRSDSDVE